MSFYLASYQAGLRVYDISNIQSPSNPMNEIAFFDTYPSNNATAFNGAWSVYPYFSSGSIIVSDIESGLFVLGKNQTLSSSDDEKFGSFSLSPNPTADLAFVKTSENNLINSIEIYNNLGQLLFSKKEMNANTYSLPVGTYKSGVYFIKVNKSITKKLIVK